MDVSKSSVDPLGLCTRLGYFGGGSFNIDLFMAPADCDDDGGGIIVVVTEVASLSKFSNSSIMARC